MMWEQLCEVGLRFAPTSGDPLMLIWYACYFIPVTGKRSFCLYLIVHEMYIQEIYLAKFRHSKGYFVFCIFRLRGPWSWIWIERGNTSISTQKVLLMQISYLDQRKLDEEKATDMLNVSSCRLKSIACGKGWEETFVLHYVIYYIKSHWFELWLNEGDIVMGLAVMWSCLLWYIKEYVTHVLETQINVCLLWELYFSSLTSVQNCKDMKCSEIIKLRLKEIMSSYFIKLLTAECVFKIILHVVVVWFIHLSKDALIGVKWICLKIKNIRGQNETRRWIFILVTV